MTGSGKRRPRRTPGPVGAAPAKPVATPTPVDPVESPVEGPAGVDPGVAAVATASLVSDASLVGVAEATDTPVVAAGGPGFVSNIDTVGAPSTYKAARRSPPADKASR